MKRRTFLNGLGAAGLASAGTGFGALPLSAARQQHLRAQNISLNSLDPAFQISTSTENWIAVLVSGALMRYAAGNDPRLEPDLATSFDISEGGSVYTFNLREGVKWHKGFGDFTAKDVKFSVDRMRDPATKARNAGQFRDIDTVEVVDDYKIRFKLKRPSAIFPHALANFRAGYLMSEAAARVQGADFGKLIVGTGPYEIEKAELNNEVVLRRHDAYFRDKPALDQISFKVFRDASTAMLAFDRQQLDVVMLQDKELLDRYATMPRVKLLVAERSTALTVLTLNTRKPPLDRKEVRQALAYAIDKPALCASVFGVGAEPLWSALPPGVDGFTNDIPRYDYNPDKAGKILSDAGIKNLTLSLTIGSHYQKFGVIFQAMLKKAGITINLDVYDPATWIRLQGGSEHDIYLSGMVRPPTGDSFLEPSYHSANNPPRGVASSFYSSIDDLIDKARVEFDEKARARIYTECVQRIAEDVPMYPIGMMKYVHAAHPYVEAANTFRVPENRPALELASLKG